MPRTQPQFRVISIGTLAAHPLWDERVETRTAHATTTLISAGAARILVDPSLPAVALRARLEERSHLQPQAITHVFLTSADALHRRALGLFEKARWLVHEPELDAARSALATKLEEAAGDGEVLEALRRDRDLLARCEPAPDALVDGVDLFPLPGVTPGCCGLLLPLPRSTVCISGDAVATVEHLAQGQVLASSHDLQQALASLAEAVEIADVLVLGRDNVVVNPLRG